MRPSGTRGRDLSGGMKRRLNLALALVHDPRRSSSTSPSPGWPPASRRSGWKEVHRLNTELGISVFLTTEYLDEANELADRARFSRLACLRTG